MEINLLQNYSSAILEALLLLKYPLFFAGILYIDIFFSNTHKCVDKDDVDDEGVVRCISVFDEHKQAKDVKKMA